MAGKLVVVFSNSSHSDVQYYIAENVMKQIFCDSLLISWCTGVATKVFVVDLETEEVDGPTVVRGNVSQTVGEFKVTLAKALRLDAKTMKIVLEKYSNEPKLLANDDRTLKAEGFFGSNKVIFVNKCVIFEEITLFMYYLYVCFFCLQIFVTSHCDDDPEKPFIISKLCKVIDRFEHTITVHMVLPETDRGKAHTLFAALEHQY